MCFYKLQRDEIRDILQRDGELEELKKLDEAEEN